VVLKFSCTLRRKISSGAHKKLCYSNNELKMKNKKKKKDAKQDLLIIDDETTLLSHPSTLECMLI
jgi:hypothetical protein